MDNANESTPEKASAGNLSRREMLGGMGKVAAGWVWERA